MKLVNKEGIEVRVGDQVSSFRGELYVIESMSEPHKPSSTGRVHVRLVGGQERCSYFPTVFNLKFI